MLPLLLRSPVGPELELRHVLVAPQVPVPQLDVPRALLVHGTPAGRRIGLRLLREVRREVRGLHLDVVDVGPELLVADAHAAVLYKRWVRREQGGSSRFPIELYIYMLYYYIYSYNIII